MKKFKIAVYAITKNEEKFVDKWVENMREADYICVLDTGSTDSTYEKLSKYNVILEQKVINPWRFDVARNESMKLVPEDADICVCIDLDELFEPGWADALRNHWTPATEKAKYLYTWNHDQYGKPKTQIWYEKIHDNSGNWYWDMPVHEALTHRHTTAPETIFLPEDTFHLHHYPDLTKSRGQYLHLMKMSIDEDPNSYMQNYYYGRELMYHKRYTDAIDQLNKTINISNALNFPANQAAAYGFIGNCHKILGNLVDAEASYITATKYVVGVREPLINLMMFYYETSRWYSLIDVGLQTIQVEQRKTEWYEDSRNYRELPHDLLSIAYYNIGKLSEGKYHIEKALEYLPEDERLLNNYKFFIS